MRRRGLSWKGSPSQGGSRPRSYSPSPSAKSGQERGVMAPEGDSPVKSDVSGLVTTPPAGLGKMVGGIPVAATSSNRKSLKIGSNVRFRGDVMECDSILLLGRLEGFVETKRLIILEGGRFVGDAKVEEADVHGSLDGTLEATRRLVVRSTGTVCGTVIYRRMV
ncbi:unnamed protein product, partial [Discosporangium mesarthrocarpum]